MGNNIIPVGGNERSDYLAFGDDSQFGETLVFAFAIVHRSNLTAVEDALAELKEHFGIPQDISLHCRVLFSGQQRQKAGLGHLTAHDARKILMRAVSIMNKGRVLVRYAVGNLSDCKAAMGSEIELLDSSGQPAETVPVSVDPKGILATLMQSCFAVPPDRSEGPTAKDCKVIVSPDTTMVNYIGSRRKRADRMYSGYSAIGAPPGEVFQLDPELADVRTQPMLQLADVAAYVCSHSYDGQSKNAFFRVQQRRFSYWLCKRYVPEDIRQPPA